MKIVAFFKKNSMKFVHNSPIDKMLYLVQIVALRHTSKMHYLNLSSCSLLTHIYKALGINELLTFIPFLFTLAIENLTPQMTELNQKMEPLALKLKMLHVDAKDDSAANRASGGDPGHQETQLLGHTSLMAEHMSLLATFKTLERKHLEQTNEFEKLRGDHQSQQTELEKLRHDHQSHQTKSEKLRRDYLSQQTELMKLRHDHQSQHAELEKLRHDHQSHQTESEKLSHDYLSQQTKLEKLRHDYESQKTQFEKLRLDYKCQQTEFASQQVLNNDLKRENTTVKDDLQNLKTQHQELQSKVEDSERCESMHCCFLTSIVFSKILVVNKYSEVLLVNTLLWSQLY